MVGVTGFEPTTSSSRTMRATKLCHTPTNKFIISPFVLYCQEIIYAKKRICKINISLFLCYR